MASMESADMRWKQRFANYKRAHNRLKNAVAFFERTAGIGSDKDIADKDIAMEDIAMEALIKCFEFTFELAWQTMKDFVSYQGSEKKINGSCDSIRGALQFDLIENGECWMDMIDDRNRATHAYDEAGARSLVGRIVECYYGEFKKFEEKMDTLS